MYIPRILCLLVHGPYSDVITSGIRNVIRSTEYLTVETVPSSQLLPLVYTSNIDIIISNLNSSPIDPDTLKRLINSRMLLTKKPVAVTVYASRLLENQDITTGRNYDFTCYTDTRLDHLVSKILS
jgi:hypothetical protein